MYGWSSVDPKAGQKCSKVGQGDRGTKSRTVPPNSGRYASESENSKISGAIAKSGLAGMFLIISWDRK